MCTRTRDRQGTPARSASRTSLANVPATCVQDARIGYIQDVLVFETLRIILEPVDVSVPPVGGHQLPAPCPPSSLAHTSTMSDNSSTYFSGTPMTSVTNRRN